MKKITVLFKQHHGKLLALLINALKDMDLAEDCLQDAYESALLHWHKNGTPRNPQAWLFTTAKHKALDKLRRATNFEKKQTEYQFLLALNESLSESDYSIPDERLRLMFTCCHPVLKENIAVALTLRLLGGLSTEEIAAAFLLKPETMTQRIVRGKKKIKHAEIAYKIPEEEEFHQRLATVLKVLYLIYNQGYYSVSSASHYNNDLSKEAIRLSSILVKLLPNNPEVKGLLALMLLNESRKPARKVDNEVFIPLENQDRNLWDKELIAQGIVLLESALKQGEVGFYQLQAAISAVHCEADSFADTDWKQIVLLYEKLVKINASPIIKLNQLAAKSQFHNLNEVLLQLDELEESLKNYQPFYATKANVLIKLRKYKKAKASFQKAFLLCENPQIMAFIKNQMALIAQQNS